MVDDGSTDESRNIIQSYGDRIRAVLKANGGQGSAFNAGFAAATGSIIFFLDSDDYYSPTGVERTVSIWNKETRILHHRLRSVDANRNEIGYKPGKLVILDAGDVVPLMLRDGDYSGPPTSGLVYSREVLEKILPMTEDQFRICADSYLHLAAPFFGHVTVTNEILAYYRIHGSNAYAAPARRFWIRKTLRKITHNTDVCVALLQKLTKERGLPVPSPFAWQDAERLFQKLLLSRADSSPNNLVNLLIFNVLKKLWTTPQKSWTYRFRVALLSFFVYLAPRFLLGRVYRNIFMETKQEEN